MPGTNPWVRVVACVTGLLTAAPHMQAQWQANGGPASAALGAVVGSDMERYLRALTIAGVVRPIAWGTRTLDAQTVTELLGAADVGAHPWQAPLRQATRQHLRAGTVGYGSVNSAFPWGAMDGALWQGRGLNVALGGAAIATWSRLTLVAAPSAMWAQNASFQLMPTVATGISPYADPIYGTLADVPQRMGDEAYARVDPGESSVRLRLPLVSVALSNASVGWGTGEAFPTILGPNAGGFPHLSLTTRARGLRVPYVATLHAQYLIGTLDQSRWSSVQGSTTFIDRVQSGTRRLMTGFAVSVVPALFPSIELGANRFYHSPFVRGSDRWAAWSRPLDAVFKENIRGRSSDGDPNGDADNQLASIFARWTYPKRGLEASMEFLREDHNLDSRDLAQQPENNSAALVSLRAVLSRSAATMSVLSLEYFNGDVSPIAQVRAQGFLYEHSFLRQGHSQRGQLLGAPLGIGAIAGSRVAWERFRPTGSTRFLVQRWRTRSAPTTDFEFLSRPPNAPVSNSHDWVLDGNMSVSRFGARGSTRSIEAGLAWAGRWQLDGSKTNLYARASWSLF